MNEVFVPVLLKKFIKAFDCISNVIPVIITTHIESIILSVTTVPNDFEKETPSYFERIPHLDISPIRGITRLAAYETKIAYTLFDFLGNSPKGANDKFHLHPLNKCPQIPNTNENISHQ